MFQVSYTNNIDLIYELDETVLAVRDWIREVSKFNSTDVCPIHYNMFNDTETSIKQKISKLYELADILNDAYPGSILKEEFAVGKEQEILNRMHVHFPNIAHDPSLKFLEDIAGQYNSLIHSLENYFNTGKSSKKCIFFFDVNRLGKNVQFLPIDRQDYKKFTPFYNFGDLALNYAHIGKNAWSIFSDRDYIIPKEQYVPQSQYSASFVLFFTANDVDQGLADYYKKRYLRDWKEFFEKRGGIDFFDANYDSEEIRLGLLKIGKLKSATINNLEIDLQSIEEQIKLKNLLLTSDLKSFKILD